MPHEVKWSQIKYHWEIYLFLAPTLVLVGLFIYYPAASGIYHSFFRWNGADINEYVGFKNYLELFKLQAFWLSFKMALMLGVFNVMKMSVALMTAVAIHRCAGARTQFFYRVLFVVPMVIPGLVVALVWRTLFFEATNGFLNAFIMKSGLFNVLCKMDALMGWGGVFKAGAMPAWLGDPKLIVAACVIWGFPWVGSFAVLTYLAKLQGISRDVYEAAEIDGVGWFSKFTKIEMPLIMGSIYILLVLMVIETIKDAGMILALAGMHGGPGGRATVPALFMLRKAFLDQQMGFACAIGIVLTLIVMILQKTLTWIMTPPQITTSARAGARRFFNGALVRLPLFYIIGLLTTAVFRNIPLNTQHDWVGHPSGVKTLKYRVETRQDYEDVMYYESRDTMTPAGKFYFAFGYFGRRLKVPDATVNAWKAGAKAAAVAADKAAERPDGTTSGDISIGKKLFIARGGLLDALVWCLWCAGVGLLLELAVRGVSNGVAMLKRRRDEARFDRNAAVKRLSNPWFRAWRWTSGNALRAARHGFIWGVLFFAFLPLCLMIIVSFKTNKQFYAAPAALTTPLHPENWAVAWDMVIPSVANSVFVSTLTTGLALVFALASAYFFARQKMPMSAFIWNAILVLMMMPMIANLVPLFRLLVDMNLVNTLTALILVGTAGGQVFAIFVLRNFVQDIPRDLYEAAEIDGANHFQQLWRIVVPLSGPIMGTVGVQLFIGAWNDFIMPLIVMRDPERLPVMVQLLRMAGEYIKFWGPLMAGYALASIPIILLFVFSMKLFVRGLTEGAVKG